MQCRSDTLTMSLTPQPDIDSVIEVCWSYARDWWRTGRVVSWNNVLKRHEVAYFDELDEEPVLERFWGRGASKYRYPGDDSPRPSYALQAPSKSETRKWVHTDEFISDLKKRKTAEDGSFQYCTSAELPQISDRHKFYPTIPNPSALSMSCIK